MSRVNVKPDELKALASDVGKLVEQSKEIKAQLQLNYDSMQSLGQGINLSAISPLYNSLVQQMEHYGTLLHSAQDAVKKTETKFREADQQLFSADGFTSFLSGTLFATVRQGVSNVSKSIKYGRVSTALTISQYLKWKYDFKTLFDPAGRKGRGAYTLSALNNKDLVTVAKMLKLNKDDDAFMKYIRNGFKFNDLKTTKSQIKKAKATIYKLPDFVAHQEFKKDLGKIGFTKAFGKQALNGFKSSYADSLKNLNPAKWKSTFKEVGKVGKAVKGLAVVGSALSVAGNVIESQKDGWQGMDAADIVTDSAVDIGSIAASAGAGAAVGSLIVPPVGTVVGAGVGIAASFAMNYKSDFLGGESIVSGTKKAIKGVTHKIASVFW
ncbi:WXG100 family type VII secretion target [Fictibacillus terranigra]|uniref:WXG100 family type VII secretion target n=1 Tax=Fictibacillus terranigra TaxID=3058424 RepID=A0ABT8E8A7_9BACL|nr:WXG100 family type VII secretion target [Fictibacillus sp. CENA-BCM004]MDN4074104.1 WXG100 family type VII secretion target [Fictibacillus sp. CENA-BCM004]